MFKKGFKKQDSSAKVDIASKTAKAAPKRKSEDAVPKSKATVAKTATKKVASDKKAKVDSKAKKHDVKATSVAYRVLRRPIITEKAADLASDNVYLFEVAPGANKVEVRNAVKALYGVTPRRVNILNRQGKRIRSGRTNGKRKNTRNAYVYLAKGVHIDIYEGV